MLIALLAAYLAASLTLSKPLTIRGVEFSFPSIGVAGTQTLLSAVDWILAAAVLDARCLLAGI